jgi:murein DD-endopeptidase MepM/ murein hydrolase activator NlpD
MMKPHQRPRVGRRRDDGIRQIRSYGSQQYPGVDLPSAEYPAYSDGLDAENRRLNPARDTGIEVMTRTERSAALAQRRRTMLTMVSLSVMIALVLGTIGWRWASDRQAAANPLVSEASGVTTALATVSKAVGLSSANVTEGPTPIFASYRTVKLHLPVPMMRLTEIGFHQAAYPWALPMKTTMKNANLSWVAKTKTTGRKRATQPSGPDAVMTGLVLRMWRSRAGKPDTAADVGAGAGAPVLSPVTGTIVRIKSYKLYGRYPDYEMHIIPDNTSGLDVVMIHLTDLSSSVGQRVEAGVTPVAKVRKLSDKFHDQLADYTKSPGDHVHIQVNDSNYKGYRGLIGAFEPDPYGDTTSGD